MKQETIPLPGSIALCVHIIIFYPTNTSMSTAVSIHEVLFPRTYSLVTLVYASHDRLLSKRNSQCELSSSVQRVNACCLRLKY